MKISASIFFFLLLSIAGLKAQKAPTGVWNTGTDNSQVEIAEADGTVVGSLVSSDNANAKIGIQLLKNFKPDGEVWKGKFYAPKKDQWLDATIQEKGNLLLITVGSGFKSKTLEWTKE